MVRTSWRLDYNKKPPDESGGFYNLFSRPTKCELFSIVSDFISKVKHVFGYGFSGYRLGFSKDLTGSWFFKSGIGLNCERFFGYDLHT